MASGREWPPRGGGGFSARGVRKAEADSPPEHGPTHLRLGPERRLRQRRDFDQVFSGGIRLHARTITIVVRRNGMDHPRLGLAISRGVVRRAVGRNRLRRRIRESFRHNMARLRGLDIVVVGRSGVESMDSNRLTELLERLWERASQQTRQASTIP